MAGGKLELSAAGPVRVVRCIEGWPPAPALIALSADLQMFGIDLRFVGVQCSTRRHVGSHFGTVAEIARHRPHIIHCSESPFSRLLGGLASVVGVKIIAETLHTHEKSSAAADAVPLIVASTADQDEQRARHPTRIVTIAQPAWFSPPRDHTQSGGYRTVATVAPFCWHAGLEHVFTAFSILRQRGSQLRLVVAGDGPEWSRVLFTIEDLELRSDLQIVRTSDLATAAAIVNAADIYVHCDLRGGMSVFTDLAESNGIPVVAFSSCTNGSRSTIKTVSTRDSVALANELFLLESDGECRVPIRWWDKPDVMNHAAGELAVLYKNVNANRG